MNQLWRNVLAIGLVLLALGMGTFGGCYAGSTVGEHFDRVNGTFGQGLEGAGNALLGLLLGTLVGFLVTAILVVVLWKKFGKRR